MFGVNWVGGDNGGGEATGWAAGVCHSKAFAGAVVYSDCNIAGSLLPSVTYMLLRGAVKLRY